MCVCLSVCVFLKGFSAYVSDVLAAGCGCVNDHFLTGPSDSRRPPLLSPSVSPPLSLSLSVCVRVCMCIMHVCVCVCVCYAHVCVLCTCVCVCVNQVACYLRNRPKRPVVEQLLRDGHRGYLLRKTRQVSERHTHTHTLSYWQAGTHKTHTLQNTHTQTHTHSYT